MRSAAWIRRFEKSCRLWQVRLGLLDWSMSFTVSQGAPPDSMVAAVGYDIDCRHAVVTVYAKSAAVMSPERAALHEMLHVVLADCMHLAAVRGSDMHVDVAREEHKAIERLLNVLDGVL